MPAEIRNKIYGYAFYDTLVVVQATVRWPFRNYSLPRKYQSSIGLLLACRQTRYEAVGIFLENCILDCRSCTLDDIIGAVPSSTRNSIRCIQLHDYFSSFFDVGRLAGTRQFPLLQKIRVVRSQVSRSRRVNSFIASRLRIGFGRDHLVIEFRGKGDV